ncbi:GDSL-type esterase/lipase family protein [uncultured Desulfobacter sp.]|uniref:GDSL-type esterase/lipase family protein n=1 Tax=uncultured Desulfobacter sp. TaxID=240139 RepID=UPI0029F4E26B|nr:GDSL-type esterase/lipase family protein [uncultured Desulfobacter sp.]
MNLCIGDGFLGGSGGLSTDTAKKISKGLVGGDWTVEDSCRVENNEWRQIVSGLFSPNYAWGSEGIEIWDNVTAWNSMHGPRGAIARDFIASVEFKGFYGHLAFRVSDQNNNGYVQFNSDAKFRSGQRSGGTTTLKRDVTLAYNGTDWCKFVVKVIGNGVIGLLYINGVLMGSTTWNSVDFATTITGKSIGPSAGTLAQNNGKPVVYRNFKFKPIKSLINVICMGDSNTGGSSVTEYNPGFAALYPGVLNNKYVHSPIGFYNAGYAGYTTSDLLDKVTTDITNRFITGATNIVTLLAGVNNMNHDLEDAATAFAGLVTLIQAILAESPNKLVVMTYPPYRSPAQEEVIEFNALIRENADIHGYDVLELHKDFTLPPGDSLNPTYCYELSGEGYHYNEIGHQMIARKIEEYLLSIL